MGLGIDANDKKKLDAALDDLKQKKICQLDVKLL